MRGSYNISTKTTNDPASSTGSSGGTASATNGGKAINFNNAKTTTISKSSTDSGTHSDLTSASGGECDGVLFRRVGAGVLVGLQATMGET